MKNNNLIVGCLATAAIAGGVGFWGGKMYNQNQRGGRFEQMENRNGNRGPSGSGLPNAGFRGGMLIGEVMSKDDKSITVKMPDGSSKIVILSSSTVYRTATDTTKDQLEVGKNIAVQGMQNADGSTTATSIELNPVMRGQNIPLAK
ncbi:MAG: DUF5666 domain-containing protein [bacterium]